MQLHVVDNMCYMLGPDNITESKTSGLIGIVFSPSDGMGGGGHSGLMPLPEEEFAPYTKFSGGPLFSP